MATGQKKRQKKLERRSAKRKQRQKTLVKQSQRGLRERLTMAATAPVLHSQACDTLWENSLGYVLLSRELPNGNVAYAMFLVDTNCMGVKNAFGDVTSRAAYDRLHKELAEKYALVNLSPADVRHLVEGAVQYADDLGLAPHADYAKVEPIFGDIDASESEKQFEFGGPNGKPHFFAGPNENFVRCQRIMSILEHSCGKDGFQYTIPFPQAVPESMRGEVRSIEGPMDEDFQED